MKQSRPRSFSATTLFIKPPVSVTDEAREVRKTDEKLLSVQEQLQISSTNLCFCLPQRDLYRRTNLTLIYALTAQSGGGNYLGPPTSCPSEQMCVFFRGGKSDLPRARASETKALGSTSDLPASARIGLVQLPPCAARDRPSRSVSRPADALGLWL